MPVDRVTELIQEGLRRKLSGDPAGAAQAWQEALGLDPQNKRARTYLDNLLVSGALDHAVAGKKKSPFARPEGKQSGPVALTPSPFFGGGSAESELTPLSMISPQAGSPAATEEPVPGPSLGSTTEAAPASSGVPRAKTARRATGRSREPDLGTASSGFEDSWAEQLGPTSPECAPAPSSTLVFGGRPAAAGGDKRSPWVRHDPPEPGKNPLGVDAPAAQPKHQASSAFETFSFGAPPAHPVAVAETVAPPKGPRASREPGGEIPGWGTLGGSAATPMPSGEQPPAADAAAAPASTPLAAHFGRSEPPEPLVPPEEPPADAASLLRRAVDLLDLDDHSGALEAAEQVLALDPSNLTARDLVSRCENTLLAMYESKIGDLRAKPKVRMRPDEIVWLNLDHRAGFVLAMVDGEVEFDDLFALSSMSRLETARILARLLQERVIG